LSITFYIFVPKKQKMNNPLISIIIPNYNHARFLNERIDSVLNQSYKNYEIIILDDHSTDNSIDIINQYKHQEKITEIVLNNENSGSTFRQWQKGFELAKGDLIWIAESDDSCENNLLETLVAEFNKDEKCVLAFCKTIKIDKEGNHLGEVGMDKNLHMDGIRFFNKYLYRFCFIYNASSVLFKKKVLSQIDWNHTNIKGSGDWILWIEISRCGNIVYINKPLNHYRIHGSNTTTLQLHSGRNEEEAIKVYQLMREKHYIGYYKELRERIAHIYAIKYGKLRNVFDNKTKQNLLIGWKNNIIITIITSFIYRIQIICGNIFIKR